MFKAGLEEEEEEEAEEEESACTLEDKDSSSSSSNSSSRISLWFQMRLWSQARTQGAYAARFVYAISICDNILEV